MSFGEYIQKVCSESYHYVGPIIVNLFSNFFVSLSFQMKEMERLINGDDLDSLILMVKLVSFTKTYFIS